MQIVVTLDSGYKIELEGKGGNIAIRMLDLDGNILDEGSEKGASFLKGATLLADLASIEPEAE